MEVARGVDQVVVVAMGEGWEVVAVRGVVWVEVEAMGEGWGVLVVTGVG